MLRQLTRSRVVLISFLILAIAPFAHAATRHWFWQPEHSAAPVATALYLLILAALLGRYRWAWLMLAVLYGAALVGWGFDSHRFALRQLLGFALNIAVFALLVSTPMRDRLRRPVSLRARSAHSSQG